LKATSTLIPRPQATSLSQSSGSALTRASTARHVTDLRTTTPAQLPGSPVQALRDGSRRQRRNSFSRSMASMMNLHSATPSSDASGRPNNPTLKALRDTSRRASTGFNPAQLTSAFAQMASADDGSMTGASSDEGEAARAAASSLLLAGASLRVELPREASVAAKGSFLSPKKAPSSNRVAGHATLRRSMLKALETSTDEARADDELYPLEEGRFVPLADYADMIDREHVSFVGITASGTCLSP
jgi:hypothetical protein